MRLFLAALLLSSISLPALADPVPSEQGVVWEGKRLQGWIKEQFGKEVYLGRTYEFMRAAGFSPQKPRPQHVKGDEAAKEAFKTKS